MEVSKGAKIRNQYNQVPHLTKDTNEKETNSPLDTTKDSQEVSLFPAGDHKAQINRRVQRHNKHKTEKNIKDPKRSTAMERSVKYFTGGLKPVLRRQPHPLFKFGSRHIDIWFAWKTPNLSMHHLLEHINQDIKRVKQRQNTCKTEYRSKRNPAGKPRWARQTAKASGTYLLTNTMYNNGKPL